MNKYLSLLLLLLVGALLVLVGLELINADQTVELVGEDWCNAMMDKPNGQWTDAETRSFAKTCLYQE